MDKRLLIFTIASFVLIGLYWGSVFFTLDPLSGKPSHVLEEAQWAAESQDSEWWLESGGIVYRDGDTWSTIQGSLEADSALRRHYLRKNPLDTDNGHHPQNVFRLFSRKYYSEPVVDIGLTVHRDILSSSPNRNPESGIFLYSRYINIDNYYFAGMQADGKAVIRKKHKGQFHTLAETQVFEGEYSTTTPSLIPKDAELTMRSELHEQNGGVSIDLYINGELVLKGVDNGASAGNIVEPAGLVGLRSDFVEISFTLRQ